MPRRRLALAFAALVAFLVPLAAHAADGDDPYTRPGFYFGVGSSLVVQTWEDELDEAIPGYVSIDKGVGFSGVFGYRFTPYVATEIHYEAVKGYDVDFNGGRLLRADSHVFTANARFYLPFERIQPYIVVGVGLAHLDIHQRFEVVGPTFNVGGRLGLGVDYYVTENWVLNASFTGLLTGFEIDVPGPDDVDGIHYMSTMLGVTYRF